MSNGKDMIMVLIVGLIKKTWCNNIIRAQKTLDASKRIKMSQFFPKPFNLHFGDSIKVNIDLSNFATKTHFKNVTHVDTSSLAN